jgi:predicted transcriptional regulator
MDSLSKRTRLTIDLPVEVKKRLRLIAAQRDVSLREYILEALQERMTEDWMEISENGTLLALTAKSDPLLAELWDNEKDAGYDRL